MQRLSMIALTAIAVLGLSGAGFTSKPAAVTPTLAKARPATAFATSYYFYSTIDGSYNDHEPISQEIYEMEEYWGCPVDQNLVNGTLLEEGFLTNDPYFPVMVWLYGHFD